MRLIIGILYLLAVFGPGECGNILIWPTRGSHWINLKIILEKLIDRGNDVTVLVPKPSPFMDTKESDRFSYQHFSVSMTAQDMHDFLKELVHFSAYASDQLNFLQYQIKFYELACKHQDMAFSYCDGILKSPEVMDILQNGKFDIVLSDPHFPCSDIVAKELSIPLVYTFHFTNTYIVEQKCDQMPSPPSFVPGAMTKLTDKMCFRERIKNMLFYLTQDIFSIVMWKRMDNYYTEYFGELKQLSEFNTELHIQRKFIYQCPIRTKSSIK